MWRKAALVLVLCAAGGIFAARPIPLPSQPQPDTTQYVESAANIVAHGRYETDDGRKPRYPPGFSLFLAPFSAARITDLGPKAAAVLLLVAVWWSAWQLGGPLAASLSIVLTVAGSFVVAFGRYYMSDALAAALAVVPVGLFAREKYRLAAASAGVGLLVRFSAVGSIVAVLVAASAGQRRRAAMIVLPFVLLIGGYQTAAFGRPWRTGYEAGASEFSLRYAFADGLPADGPFYMFDGRSRKGPPVRFTDRHVAVLTNAEFYTAVLAGGWWVFTVPGAPLIGLAVAIVRRRAPHGRYAFVLTASTWTMFVLYFFQSPRFLAPAVCALIPHVSSALVSPLRRASINREQE